MSDKLSEQHISKRKYFLKKDKLDSNNPNHKERVLDMPRAPLPLKIDLRLQCPPVYDQGDLGSCTANAIGAAYAFVLIKQKLKTKLNPSRLFIYYNERKMENTIDEDAGAAIVDGITSVHNVGVCDEISWPYDISKFNSEPPALCYQDAQKHKTIQYKRIQQSLAQLRLSLAGGYPIVFGMAVYASFESESVAKNGVVPLPKPKEECMGGHAVLIVGYTDSDQRFIVRNSWGPNWGDKGYFYLPYQYVTNPKLCFDFWSIVSVTDK